MKNRPRRTLAGLQSIASEGVGLVKALGPPYFSASRFLRASVSTE